LDDAKDLVLPGDADLKDSAKNLGARLAKTYLEVKENSARAAEKQKKYYDKNRRTHVFKVGDLVLRDHHVLSDASKQFAAKLALLRKGPF
jgi:hypothetical protein